MHYDALIHREITTHIAHYISCGFNKTLSKFDKQNEDNDLICSDIIQSMINKIDYQLTSFDKRIINEYRPWNINFDMIENLNEKEKDVLYLIDYYENNSFE
jgi:hypothetical protein